MLYPLPPPGLLRINNNRARWRRARRRFRCGGAGQNRRRGRDHWLFEARRLYLRLFDRRHGGACRPLHGRRIGCNWCSTLWQRRQRRSGWQIRRGLIPLARRFFCRRSFRRWTFWQQGDLLLNNRHIRQGWPLTRIQTGRNKGQCRGNAKANGKSRQ